MKVLLIIALSWLVLGKGPAQSTEWQLISSVSPGVIDQLSTDRNSHVFIADRAGNIRQYNSAGDSVNVYSPAFRAKLTNLETQWTVSLFLFSADLQQFELLDRFLRPITTASVRDHGLGVIRQATLGNGNVIWMVDETRLSLVKWDYRRQVILQEQPFSLILDNDFHSILNIAERKNLLFLHSKDKGVLIFDNQANLVSRLPGISDTELYFSDDFAYYLDGSKAYRIAYTSNETESFDLPNTTYQKIAVSPTRILLSTGTRVDIFKKPANW